MRLPKFVSMFHDRHGAPRYRFRRKGIASCYLPDPQSPQFAPVYQACLAMKPGDPAPVLPAHVEPRPVRGVSYVYFLGGAGGAVKIGYSRDVPSRLSRLRSGNPTRLRLLAIVEGGEPLERSYHDRFEAARIDREWFKRTPEMSEEIARLRRVRG